MNLSILYEETMALCPKYLQREDILAQVEQGLCIQCIFSSQAGY